MAPHPLDRPIGSDLSFEVLKLRTRRAELGTPHLDSVNKALHPLPSALVQREAFVADREPVGDSFQGEGRFVPADEIAPTWRLYGGK